MTKSRKNKSYGLKTITTSTGQVLPVVYNGLNSVGNVAKGVVVGTLPVLQNGVSSVYGTLANGVDYGVKGMSNVASGIKIKSIKRHKNRRHHSRKKSHKRRNKHTKKNRH